MKVKLFATLRQYINASEVEIENLSTIHELLHKLGSIYGKGFEKKLLNGEEISDEIVILVNGKHIGYMKGINTELSESDEISIFPVVIGG
jgi:sulfur-carrier protein